VAAVLPDWDAGREHVARSADIVVAHNAQFELAIWNNVMVKRFGWPRLDPRQVRCTMAACYAMGLPGALENAAHALGLKVAKDIEGRALMLKMCKPRAFDGRGRMKSATSRSTTTARRCAPGSANTASVDVAVEREIYKRVLPLTDREQRVWTLDQEINNRGVPFDIESIRAALTVADKEKERLDDEMAKVTEGAVTACSNVGSLKEWAADYGVMPDSLAKAELNELLDYEDLPEPVSAALKLRQSAGRFTSISKLKAIMQREIARRVPFLFQYHAATTGRWAGRGVQPHNFTRDLPETRPRSKTSCACSARAACAGST
jgi:DNA polymerase